MTLNNPMELQLIIRNIMIIYKDKYKMFQAMHKHHTGHIIM